MVRSGSNAVRQTPKVRPAATILFAGPLGTGVGIAADIAAEVARLSHRTVVRRRDFTQADPLLGSTAAHAAPKPIVLQVVSFGDGTHTADPTRIDIAIVWDHASAAALKASGIEAGETLIVDHESLAPSTVPIWRRDLITDTAGPHFTGSHFTGSPTHDAVRKQARGLQCTARALKALSRRVPFTRELWERVLKLHVPTRRRRATAGEFSK